MKSKFPGYFKLSENEINELWDNALFTFDANIILNLYRYSDETREEFFKILAKVNDRIWIPYQSAQEFFDNRLNVISQQEKAYEEAVLSLNSIENEFKNSRQHPFIKKNLLKRFSTLRKDICDQLNESKAFHNKRIIEDDILERIESLFENKVGEEYAEKDLESLYKEGETRFANKIPPGYKDSNKKDDSDKNIRKYGDFIVWKQIISKSKKLNKGIILVTDDRKEDWWIRFKGKTVSPRPELIKEFSSDTNQSFHMYQSDRFLEFARDYLNEDVNERAIEEIRELRRLDEEIRISNLRKEQEKLKFREFRETIMKERMMLEQELKYLHEKRNHIEKNLDEQYLVLDNSDPSAFDERHMIEFKHEYQMLEAKIEQISHRINDLQEKEYHQKIRNKTLHNKKYTAFGR